MRALVVQANWLLKKAHYANLGMKVPEHGEEHHCGGIIGFLEKLKEAMDSQLFDKVVVVWDGAFDGADKYNGIPVMKAKKQEAWANRDRIRMAEPFDLTKEERHERAISEQREVLQGHLDMLNIRQIDEDGSESTDAIALYVNEAVKTGESITILSREHEFFQLISDDVSVLLWDGSLVKRDNFLSMYGYDNTNDLMVKCFVGMPSSVITGVKGLTIKRMLRYFSGLKLEHYAYADMIAYARRKRIDVRLKIYDAVLSAHDIVVRNSKLINMKDPLFNSDLNEQKNYCLYSPLENDRLDEIRLKYNKYKKYMSNEGADFFLPFQRTILKEKEYTLFHKQVNI